MKLSERLEERLSLRGNPPNWANEIFIDSTECRALLADCLDLARRVEGAPVAIMDTRDVLGLCAPSEEDFPSLHALQGKRVALVPLEERSHG